MRITNRCNVVFDGKRAIDGNKATGDRVVELIIKRPKSQKDRGRHGYVEKLPEVSKFKIVLFTTPKVQPDDLMEWFGHELCHILLLCGDIESVCDVFGVHFARCRE